MTAALGLDTSNYTTSAAVCRADGMGSNAGRLLDVPAGALGLRQSEALFQHVRCLPGQLEILRAEDWLQNIAVVGASTRPRWVEGSYMPCFLAGASQGESIAKTLGVPFFACSHQQGHIAAACWSAGRMELLDKPHLAWHLSGGTTELLLVEPEGSNVRAARIGGTTDISAGQLIDRAGKLLGLNFPAGAALDELARQSEREDWFAVRLTGLCFSLSGMENQAKQRAEKGGEPADIARFVLLTVAHTVRRITETAQREYPGLPVLFSGGVASNSLLRQVMEGAAFAMPAYSTDNAMGVALLALRSLERGEMG